MNAFKKKKISVETLGEYLSDTRVSHNMDHAQVSRLTQIPEKFLMYLEEGEYDKLPADVYVKGFLKSLARVYQISFEPLLTQFENERGVERSIKKDSLSVQSSYQSTKQRFAITPRTFTAGVVAILVLLALGYLYWQVRSVSAPPGLSILYPENDLRITSRNILLRGTADTDARVFINDQEILVGDGGEFQKILSLAEGSNFLRISAENKFNKKTVRERTVVVVLPVLTSTSSLPIITEDISVTISIEDEPTWITIESDGIVVQDGLIEANTQENFIAKDLLVITTGNAGQTRVIYNGKDLGVLGSEGEVLSDIRFTAE